MTLLFRAAISLCAALVCAGCGLTSPVETSQQLEGGDRVVSTTFGWPGYYLWLPRVNVLGMQGIGDVGDFSGHAGINRTSIHAGLGGRVYPVSDLTVGLRTELQRVGEGAEVRGFDIEPGVLTTVTPRAVTTTEDERPFYVGLQSNLVHRLRPADPEGGAFSNVAWSAEAVGGFDHLFVRRGFQMELVVSLITFDESVADVGTIPSIQLNLGGYMYFSS